ncbi:DUF1269 domain-containing protein [Geodermatophilus sp. URMC 62]|uniref:DUF1269 domain-containing protein n=1 Tax=Geodermatophilus sp. URMC 62 TaxID=3423414 RepID=UPI00406C9B55
MHPKDHYSTPEITMSHNVIAIAFGERSRAFEALSELKGAGFEGRVDVLSAAVVERDADGLLSVPDGVDNVGGAGWTAGGLVGLTFGILGGPVGMLFGWATGALIGSADDVKRAGDSTLLLDAVSAAIPAGGTALFAEVEESTEEILDGLAASLGGVLTRRPAEEVLAELEIAQRAFDDARQAADKAARQEKRAVKKAEIKQDLTERKEALKAKLGKK